MVQPATKAELHRVISDAHVDVAVVVAFGMLLPSETLAIVKRGFVNVHFSLLPRWRGAAPVERAIMEGDEYTGVSLMVLNEGLDTGPVFAAAETPIGDYESAGELTARLASIGAELLASHLGPYVSGALAAAPQLEASACLAPKLTPDEARLDVSGSMDIALRAVRAFQPRPGAWLMIDGERAKVLEAVATDQPSTVGRIEGAGGRPIIGFPDGSVEILTMQPAGKAPMSGTAWLNGRRGRSAVVE